MAGGIQLQISNRGAYCRISFGSWGGEGEVARHAKFYVCSNVSMHATEPRQEYDLSQPISRGLIRTARLTIQLPLSTQQSKRPINIYYQSTVRHIDYPLPVLNVFKTLPRLLKKVPGQILQIVLCMHYSGSAHTC